VPAADVPWVLDRLRGAYGPPPAHRRLPALDELVLTILSQNTSDVNRDRAHAAMRRRFPAWEDVLAAPPGELVEAIRPGGLANQKAPRIQAVLATLAGGSHGLDLEWLAGLDGPDALDWLTALPGVGIKTASCVLLFSLGEPVMPVDTHVHRVASRLGLIPERTSAEAAHALLTAATPPGRMLEAHLLLIMHGRRTCRAQRPLCADCPLLERCPHGRAVLGR
jgi:endonuclease-3